MFAGTVDPVHMELLNRTVDDGRREHLAKLAEFVLRFADAFPYHCWFGAWPRSRSVREVSRISVRLPSASSREGAASGFIPIYLVPVDFRLIRRIAAYAPMPPFSARSAFGTMQPHQRERDRRQLIVDLSLTFERDKASFMRAASKSSHIKSTKLAYSAKSMRLLKKSCEFPSVTGYGGGWE
jgi:hypothetical protein